LPTTFNWPLFAIAWLLMAAPVLHYWIGRFIRLNIGHEQHANPRILSRN
jgi:hypothetical protein